MSRLMESAIQAYSQLGWSLMALPFGEKKADQPGWQDAPDDVPFLEGLAGGRINLAVRLGKRSGMLADVDLDTAGAVALAPHLLPPTRCKSGTDERPGSHWWYTAPDGPLRDRGTARYASPSGGAGVPPVTYAELRWAGGYTVLPPSLHPDGWLYEWEGRPADDPLPPPAVAWDSLDRSVREVAGAALLLECYPEWERQRSRHHASLALAGALLGAGWDALRVERFVFALASAGGDEEAADRVDNARGAADRLRRGDRLHGWPVLADLAGSQRVDRLKRFLELDQGAGGWAAIMGSATNGPVPPGGGVSGAAGKAPAASTGPQAGPTAGQPAPVISTAQQAAQQTAAQTRTQATKDAEVAFNVHLAITHNFWLARDEGLGLYVYEDGVYRYDPGELRLRLVIQAEILNVFGVAYLKPEVVNDVLYHLRVNVPDLDPVPRRGWLHVLNGRLNVLTGDLEPHDPAHRTTTLLPITYDKSATCPAIEQFCAQVFPADAMALGVPWQVVAMCSCPLQGIDKAILLLGPGENGKGIYLEIVQAFVGAANASHVSLQRIESSNYATADLRGKVLNVCSDLPSSRLEDSGDFKAIVSGEAIRAERKFKDAFDFVPFCRLLFSANNLPESVDTSTGYFRRWYLIPFGVSFAPGNPQRREREELLAELLTPQELSGLLNAMLPHLRQFLAGAQPAVTDSMTELIEEFVAIADPFPNWLQGALQADPQGWVQTALIAQRYAERMARRGRDYTPSPQAVGDAIAEAFPGSKRTQRRAGGSGSGAQANVAGKRKWGWQGVSWRLGHTP